MVAGSRNRFDFEWVRFLGAQIVEAADGRCVMRLHPSGVHLNHNGNVNAPILYGLAEVAGAGAVTAGMMDLLATAYVVVRRANIEYLAPAHDTVTAVGTVQPSAFATAKSDITAGISVDVAADVEITDVTGRITTQVNLTITVRPGRTG
jgi:acyl-coenzyme A thioesterase PaaI-like protein